MKKILLYPLAAFLLMSCGSNEPHFITDTAYREQVHTQFLERKEFAKNRDQALFGVFSKQLTNEQCEALEFLYAYMPLNDLADYDGDFFLKQVDVALATREAFAWGKTIPEEIFRHFVLPYRVNNENMDTARMVFFPLLKERLKGLSMYDAALEVNHWCHERVTYQPTDGRTSAPLSTIRTAWGRCGEESTFTVTALRAAGIPARQCYTPRWAHTDDNHAWVEVWVDGKWRFLGACEPEPELDIAWFNAPVKRAMMVHTNVFGAYNGNEETMIKNHIYSKINLISNYAPVKQITIKVIDANNTPVEKATVQFKLYNYSEFYNLATKTTDSKGIATLTSGYGDLLAWATNGNIYGYAKVDGATTDTVIININRKAGAEYNEDMDIVPPLPIKIDEVPTAKELENNRRLKQEDSMRGAYEATFPTQAQSIDLAQQHQLPEDKTWDAVRKCCGNWRAIGQFLRENSKNEYLFDFIGTLADKDLRDAQSDTLSNHLVNAENKNNYPREIFVEGVLAPRIRNEMLVPWRSFLQAELPTHARENANAVIDWVRKNITVNTADSYYNCPITPVGVYNLRIADAASRDIFFVAVCRASGIAARIDAATATPQYYENGKWNNVTFEPAKDALAENATLTLSNSPANTLVPQYYINYTLAHFVNGDFVSLDYENSPLVAKFPCSLHLAAGYYKLTTGNRADDGSVLTRTVYFNLVAGETKTMPIELRPIVKTFEKKGSVNLQRSLKSIDGKTDYSLQQLAKGKGLALVFIDPTREPSRHVMNDIPNQRAAFEKWGGNMLFAVAGDKLDGFNPVQYNGLPAQSLFAADSERAVTKALLSDLKIEYLGTPPVVLLINPQGEVVFVWQGYRIGIGDDLIKAIKANGM